MARDQPVLAEKASKLLDIQLLARRWLGPPRGDHKPLSCPCLCSNRYSGVTTFALRTDEGFGLPWLAITDRLVV